MTYPRGHITRFTFEQDEEVMKILDEVILQLKAKKFIATQESMDWLKQVTVNCHRPGIAKVQEKSHRLRQTNSKQLPSFSEAINQLITYFQTKLQLATHQGK